MATTAVKGLAITITPKFISRMTNLSLGVKWNREDRVSNIAAKKSFFFPNEEFIEEKNGVRRESLPYPWDEVAFHIMK